MNYILYGVWTSSAVGNNSHFIEMIILRYQNMTYIVACQAHPALVKIGQVLALPFLIFISLLVGVHVEL